MSKLIAIVTFKKDPEKRRFEAHEAPVPGYCYTNAEYPYKFCAFFNMETGCSSVLSGACFIKPNGLVFKEVK